MYSLSPKNQSELDAIAESVFIEFLKVKKVLDIRWVFLSYLSMKAVWQDLPVFYEHFRRCSADICRNVKQRSKSGGLAYKIQSWFFLAKIPFLKDALF